MLLRNQGPVVCQHLAQFEGFAFVSDSVLDSDADSHGAEAGTEKIPFQVPLLCFGMVAPVDGYPCLADWLNNLKDILNTGFESHREATEIRPLAEDLLGRPMTPFCVTPSKGWGRISCIWFAILHTFKTNREFREDELQDMKRQRTACGFNFSHDHSDNLRNSKTNENG